MSSWLRSLLPYWSNLYANRVGWHPKKRKKKGIDLNKIIENSNRTIKKVGEVIQSGKDLDQVDWHRLVINQPCPFLSNEGACPVYEDRP
ncbi:MAG: hypothetical protein CM1200mP16_10840 [Nitrospina sp.]|nr:MAG: hypothetical protein CM1200mP16_10840 [Nitrospina sp.]